MSLGDTIRDLVGGRARQTPTPGSEGAASSVDSATSSPDLAALKAEARKGGKRARKVGIDEALANQQLQSAIDELYSADNWDEIGALYFETRYALTGFDGFRLSDKQRKVISSSLAMTMKTLAITDPKWIAITIFSINFGGLIAQKEMAYAKAIAEIKRDRARNGNPPPGR